MGKQKKATTIRDVAARAQVSVATVSNVLNDKRTVAPAIREAVLQVVEEIGYARSPRQQLRTPRLTRFIGLISADVTDPIMTLIFKGIENVGRIHGYTSILCDSENSVELEREHIESLMRKGVDGLLIVPSSDSLCCAEEIRRRELPFVAVDRRVRDADVSYVVSDNTEGAYQAVKYLLSLGHRDIAFLSGRSNLSTATERFVGYRKALEEWGVPLEEELVRPGDFEWEGAFESISGLVRGKVPFTAVFAANDVMAFAAKEALEQNGLRVYDDVSLIGYNDFLYASAISLTTVALEPLEMGRNAALLLFDLIEKRRTPPYHVTMKPRLIIRSSCRKID
ncbi:MAG: LacI family DNA-binding transcriptional regulator [Spirochaetales bacterium]|nr:LacI family DNA-binding transcriptional regulator [Spirochaetales bacterium]